MTDSEINELTPLERSLQQQLMQTARWNVSCPDTQELCEWIELDDLHPQAARLNQHLFMCPICQAEFLRLRALWRETSEVVLSAPLSLPLQSDALPLSVPREAAVIPTPPSISWLDRIKRWIGLPTLAFASAVCAALIAIVVSVRLARSEQHAAAINSRIVALTQENQTLVQQNTVIQQQKQVLRHEADRQIAQQQNEASVLRTRLEDVNKALVKERSKPSAPLVAQLRLPNREQMQRLGELPTLMGGPEQSPNVELIAPMNAILPTPRPTFRWKPVKEADSYHVSVIAVKSGDEVFSNAPLVRGTRWSVPTALLSGALYEWKVTALHHKKEIASSVSAPIFIQ